MAIVRCDRAREMDPPSVIHDTGRFFSMGVTMSSLTSKAPKALTVVLFVVSCQRTELPLPADTTAREPATAESPGALFTRHEAQASLDRARVAFQRKDLEASRSELADAAGFMRTEAQEVGGDARETLRRAADELDSLAARVAKGEVRTTKTLDRFSLCVNRAEATHHLLRAKDAIAKGDHTRAGEELTMSVDHLERAAKDAGQQTDAAVRAAVADTRTLAGEMLKGVHAVPDEVTKVTEELENAILRLDATARVTKEPRGAYDCPGDVRVACSSDGRPAGCPSSVRALCGHREPAAGCEHRAGVGRRARHM